MLQGKAQDAHNMLMAAVSSSPSYAEAYNNLGVLQRDVGAVEVTYSHMCIIAWMDTPLSPDHHTQSGCGGQP